MDRTKVDKKVCEKKELAEDDTVIYQRSKNVMFLVHGAEHSKYNAWHWFRYLRKIIDENGGILLNDSNIKELLSCSRLTDFQKVTLKRAVTIGTPTYQYIRSLNQICQKNMLKEFFRRHPNAEKRRRDFLKIK